MRDVAGDSLYMVVCGFKADLCIRNNTPVKVPGIPYWPISSKETYNFEKPFLFLARKLSG